jgi:hypothetical protein
MGDTDMAVELEALKKENSRLTTLAANAANAANARYRERRIRQMVDSSPEAEGFLDPLDDRLTKIENMLTAALESLGVTVDDEGHSQRGPPPQSSGIAEQLGVRQTNGHERLMI